MTKKHYQFMVELLSSIDFESLDNQLRTIKKCADFFRIDNPRFDEGKFVDAVILGIRERLKQ